jgi:hypothetical protein
MTGKFEKMIIITIPEINNFQYDAGRIPVRRYLAEHCFSDGLRGKEI